MLQGKSPLSQPNLDARQRWRKSKARVPASQPPAAAHLGKVRPQLLLGAEEPRAGDHCVQHGRVALRLAHQSVQLLQVLRETGHREHPTQALPRTPARPGPAPQPSLPAPGLNTWKLLEYTSPLREPWRLSTPASTAAAAAYSPMLAALQRPYDTVAKLDLAYGCRNNLYNRISRVKGLEPSLDPKRR